MIINDKILIENVRFELDEEKPGDSVVIHFPEIEAKSLKFVVEKAPEGIKEVGISEIFVMAKTSMKR